MTAYLIAEVEVGDPVAYEAYKTLAQAAIAAHGGRYVVRGGAIEALEGRSRPGRLVIVEFASLEVGRQFYNSELYRRARAAREGAARCSIILAPGVGDDAVVAPSTAA